MFIIIENSNPFFNPVCTARRALETFEHVYMVVYAETAG